MLGILSSVVNDYSQIESSRWIVIAVCVVGVILAWVTDEGYSLLGETSTLESTKAQKPSGKIASSPSARLLAVLAAIGNTFLSVWMPIYNAAYPLLPSTMKYLCDRVASRTDKLVALFTLYRSSLRLQSFAKSRRHFFYLMEKEILGLPIRQDETEIDSYQDCKHYLGRKWPFMWEVSDVKADKIECVGSLCIPMSSYSYLDLLRDESVQEAAIAAAKVWSTGNHGPRMLGGNTTILCQLERKMADFYKRDAALLCATGYLACMSACAAVSGDRTVLFADSRLHASLRAGLKIGTGKTILFRHNDFTHLEQLMKDNRKKYEDAWVIIESVYSMDGDIGDLPAAAALAKKYDCNLMMDEAHGMGVVGKTGRGLEEHFGMQGVCTLIVGTFSKSTAGIGGYICGPQKLVEYMDFHAPGNVFSASLPAYCAGGVLRALEIIDERPELVTRAQNNTKRLRELLTTGNNKWPADYPDEFKYEIQGDPVTTVIPLIFHDDVDRVMRVATGLRKKGFMVSAVAYPACPLREPRFRITATSGYTEEIMCSFVDTLVEVCLEEPPASLRQTLVQ